MSKQKKEKIEKDTMATKNGEVFTPLWLIGNMISKLPKEVLENPDSKILEPSAGMGNIMVMLLNELMKTLRFKIPDERIRMRHILEKMLFMVEFTRDNCDMMEKLFQHDPIII